MTSLIEVERLHALGESEGYTVEAPEGALGWVEEVWLDERREPRALAVRTVDGRRALLLAEQVTAVDQEHGWVVAETDPRLLELDPPRLTEARDGRLTASWTTTGTTLEPPAAVAQLPLAIRVRPAPAQRRPATGTDWPLAKTVAVLYGTIALLIAFMITLAFTIAWAVTGTPY
jgi:hypothetical protein